MNAHWMDRPAVLPAIASHLAARRSARQASRAAAWMRWPSRCSAPDALTVRNAPSIRSSAAPITPTLSWARRAARPILGTTRPMTTAARMNTPSVTPNSTRSSRLISTSVAIRVMPPVTTPTIEPVVTSRSSVVSEADARHQVAGLGAVQPGDREPQQPVHQPPPRGEHHRLRGPLQHVAAQRAEHGVGHHQARHQQQELRDGAMVAQIVDQRPDDQRQRQAGRRGEQAQQAPRQQREAVRPHVAVHDPPAGAFAAAAPVRLVCLGGHRDLPHRL